MHSLQLHYNLVLAGEKTMISIIQILFSMVVSNVLFGSKGYHVSKVGTISKKTIKECLTSPNVFKVYDKVRKAAIFMEGLTSGDSTYKFHNNRVKTNS